jgi:molybdopterin-guanine dinucleotide biosynthesis protein A
LSDIYVSGDLEGYRCIPDTAPHEGPAYAIYDILAALEGYDGVLFVPIDMPLLSIDALRLLIREEKGGYFKGAPLPAFIPKLSHKNPAKSVKALLENLHIYPLILPPELEQCMVNTNTPEEWEEALRA